MKNVNIELPSNLIAERMVIKSILMNNISINYISQNLSVEAFYFKEYREIYKASLLLFTEGKNVNLTTLANYLEDKEILSLTNSIKLIYDLIQENTNFLNIDEYIELMNEKYLRRLLIQFGNEIVEFGYDTNFSLETIFQLIEAKLTFLTTKTSSKNISTSTEILTEILFELKEKNKSSLFSGYLCNFDDLNLITQGFQKTDLIVIAGRPAMGKTAFALNLTLDILKLYRVPVVIFSLEMTKQQLMYRLISLETNIPIIKLKLGQLNRIEWLKINESIKNLSKLPIYIDDTPNIKPSEIRSKIKKLKLICNKIGPIIIDYLQLLETEIKVSTRAQEISNITRTLKNLAREFQVPIIVLSQLSRNVESRLNKRPILSDLRDSGCFNISTLKQSYSKYLYLLKFNKFFICSSFLLKNLILNSNLKFRFTGLRPTYKISISSGSNIYITNNHKLKINLQWKNLNFLNLNSLLQINFSNLQRNFLFKKILFDRIKRINYCGIEKTYDLKLEKIYNFISANIIIHNSIEQDADIVLMLHRDNYYKKNSSKKNIVEIRVAKHRAGPTGNLRLFF